MSEEGLLLSSLVYGGEYAKLFLGVQLVSLLDGSNVGALKGRASFLLFTDRETRVVIEAHPRWEQLRAMVPCEVMCLRAPTYDQRYDMQSVTLGLATARAYRDGRVLMYMTADGNYGAGCVPAIMAKMGEGYDSVCCGVPLRVASEALAEPLERVGRALSAGELFEVGFRSIHPIWLAAHWESPCFSEIPYAMVWSDPEHLVVRATSVSVHAQRVSKKLLGMKGCPDMVMFPCSENPYMALDWSEFPIVNVEPLRCFYPPFRTGVRASVGGYLAWAAGHVARDTLQNLRHRWRYEHPDRRPSEVQRSELMGKSDAVIEAILAQA